MAGDTGAAEGGCLAHGRSVEAIGHGQRPSHAGPAPVHAFPKGHRRLRPLSADIPPRCARTPRRQIQVLSMQIQIYITIRCLFIF
mgnify:CR=1 FL=1